MYIHTFALKWKAEATEEQKQRATEEILALQGRIPGLLETHVGKNDSPRGNGHRFGGVMLFRDKPAFDSYFTHPLHEQLIAWLMPLIDPTELDFEPISSKAEFTG
jgi:hypothetical protein